MWIDLDDGKYTYRFENGGQSALRNGLPWRDLTGDDLVYHLAHEVDRLRRLTAAQVGEHSHSARPTDEIAAFADANTNTDGSKSCLSQAFYFGKFVTIAAVLLALHEGHSPTAAYLATSILIVEACVAAWRVFK